MKLYGLGLVVAAALAIAATFIVQMIAPFLPMFVVGFLVMVLVRASGWLAPVVVEAVKQVAGFVFTMPLVGVGARSRSDPPSHTWREAIVTRNADVDSGGRDVLPGCDDHTLTPTIIGI